MHSDLSGQVFGEWTVLEYDTNGKYKCRCSCGTIKSISGYSLRNGKSKSCGHSTTKFKDLKGQVFGEWTVKDYVGNGYWKCRCSCGNEKNILGYYLLHGKSKSCGHNQPNSHISKDKQFKNLKNQQFGEWTVLEYSGNGMWRCRCSCGREKDVNGKSMRLGMSKSCGHDRLNNLAGRKFGRLTVKEYVGDQKWRCICDCGNEVIVFAHNLLREGGTKSCGCIISDTKIKKDELIDFIHNFYIKNNRYPFIDELMHIINRGETVTRNLIKEYKLESLINRTSRSIQEREIADILRENNNIVTSCRDIIPDLELDIYIPDKKIAIEFNGSYWHSEIYKDKYYHQKKTIECAKRGIRLIHIFEYEYNSNREKILAFLKNAVNINDNTVIYARETEIREVGNSEALEFCEKYHLGNGVKASIRLGLYHNNELVQLMTFGKPRFNSEYEYEVYRLVTKFGVNVAYGINKLFKHFLRIYKPKSVLTYVDIAKFTGNSYLKVGFKLCEDIGISKPNYVWVEPYTNQTLTRYQAQKHRLVEIGLGDTSESESSIMHNNGYYKLYDSGNIRMHYIL